MKIELSPVSYDLNSGRLTKVKVESITKTQNNGFYLTLPPYEKHDLSNVLTIFPDESAGFIKKEGERFKMVPVNKNQKLNFNLGDSFLLFYQQTTQ